MSELDLAQRALSFTRGEAQATVTRERSLFSRFAVSRPTQDTRIDDVSVAIFCVHDGHTGSADTNDVSDAGLQAVAAQADAAARSAAAAAPGPGDYPDLPGPAPVGGHDGYDAATALLDPAVAGAALQTAFDGCAARGTEAFGLWTAGVVDTAIASSRGVAVADTCTDAFMKVIARDRDGRSGWATGAGSAISDLDPAALTERAAAKVTREEPLALEPGAYPVVLEADAVGTLLDFLGAMAFNGQSHAEGRGALAGRLGEVIAAPAITLSDAPGFARTLPRAFDAEGVPKTTLPLIEDGVARAVVHDRRSGSRAGTASTGHALIPGGSSYGPHPTNLVLDGSDAATEADLVAPIERGIYVTRLWYVNPVDEKATLLTGTTRDGTFLIEDGRVTRPLLDVRFTDSVLRLLTETEALGAAEHLACEADFYGRRFASGVVCPPLRAQGFRVTGRTV